jgi:magnesium transporter
LENLERKSRDEASPAEEVSSVQGRVRRVAAALEAEISGDSLVMLAQLHPADQASVIQIVSSGVRNALAAALTPGQFADILENLDEEEAASALRSLDHPALAAVLDEVRPEVAADVLQQLPAERAGRVLVESAHADEIAPLIAFPKESAGGLMAPVTITVSDETTVNQFMSLLRHFGRSAEGLGSYFVVDTESKLLGTVALGDLVFSEPGSRIHDVMQEPVATVDPELDQEEVARLMDRYSLSEVPVVDAEGRLLGTITLHEVFEVAQEEATEDMHRLAGLGSTERMSSTIGRSVLKRFPWLLLNLATVVLAAAVIAAFENTISRLLILAAFIPVVASQGGAAATQTLTLMVRSLALGEITFRRARSIVLREAFLGMIHGLLLGLLIAGLGLVLEDKAVLGLALFIAMTANMVVAALAGALVPLGFRAVGIDPALASVVVVTTVTDVAGFAIFLSTAALLLQVL